MINLYQLHNDPKKLDLYNLYAIPIDQMCDESLMEQDKDYDYQPVLHIIKKSPREAYLYALDEIKGRWLEAEPYIMKDTFYALCYSGNVMRERWPDAEPIIMTDSTWWEYYCRNFGI